MTFQIEPYVGPLPVRLAMNEQEVCQILGPPRMRRINWMNAVAMSWESINAAFSNSDGGISEIVFAPGCDLRIDDFPLFSSDPFEAIGFLRRYDPEPVLLVGFLVFEKLGLRLSGFHDGDEPQKAVGLVRRGYWDEYREDFVPFDESGN